MSYDDDEVFKRLDQEIEDERNARAELAWQIDPKPVDPLIENAANRKLPPGHISFLGGVALPRYNPDL